MHGAPGFLESTAERGPTARLPNRLRLRTLARQIGQFRSVFLCVTADWRESHDLVVRVKIDAQGKIEGMSDRRMYVADSANVLAIADRRTDSSWSGESGEGAPKSPYRLAIRYIRLVSVGEQTPFIGVVVPGQTRIQEFSQRR